jgi:hypothetical protein
LVGPDVQQGLRYGWKVLLPDYVIKLVGLFDGDARSAAKSLGHRHNLDNSGARKLLGKEFIANEASARAMAKTIIDLGLI